MVRAMIAGDTSYSHQSFEDMVEDLKVWIVNLNETQRILCDGIKKLKETGYWDTVVDRLQDLFAYSIHFYRTSEREITEILKEIEHEVRPDHIARINSLCKTAYELNIHSSDVWKADWYLDPRRNYTAKDYGNPDFKALEDIHSNLRAMAADMLDLSNLAARLEDFVGKKGVEAEPLTKKEGCENMMDPDYIAKQLMRLVQLYELSEEATSFFHGTQHDQLVDALNKFLFHHGPAIGIEGWGDNIQGMRDGGVDAVWNCHGRSTSIRLGIQIKSPNDFERDEDASFRRTVLAQIAESRQMDLSKLILGLCADLTSRSQREKCRGLLADIARMTDEYVVAVAPTKMAGIWRWSLGLQTKPLDQIREAGYAWLTAIYDSLGNLNQNSWGKGTGGAWSHPKTTTVRVGQQVLLSAIANPPVSGDIQYQFSVQRSGQGFEVRQDWSPNSNWTWNVAQADIGRQVVVKISVRRTKDYYQFNDADDYTYAIYDVLPMKQN